MKLTYRTFLPRVGIPSSDHRTIITCAVTLLFGFTSPSLGNTYQSLGNQRNILPGGRAALLAGAFEAIADDSTAGFYNPAGLAWIKEQRLQVSSTAYKNATTTYEKAIDDRPFRESSSGFFPNFIGGTISIGKMRLGYSFLTLDLDNIYQQDRYEDLATAIGSPKSYSRTYQEKSDHLWAGGSLAARLTDRLSLGFSAYYYQRTSQVSANEVFQLDDDSMGSIVTALDTLNTGAAMVAGALWRQGTLSLALVTRIPHALTNQTTQTFDRLEYQAPGPQSTGSGQTPLGTPRLTTGQTTVTTLKELSPTTLALGAAWAPRKKTVLSASLLLHEPQTQGKEAPGELHTRTRLDGSLGVEFGVGPVSLMGGFFTNNSLYTPASEGLTDQPPAIDFNGTTTGASLDFGGFTGYLGIIQQSGQGTAQIRSADAAIQNVGSHSLTYLLSGKVPL